MNIGLLLIISIIAVPIYFVLKWSLKKWNTSSETKNTTAIVGTLILAPIIYIVIGFATISYITHEPQYDFNKDKWTQNKLDRHQMKEDIVQSNILIGLNKTETEKLLGQSDNSETENIWIYDLGISQSGIMSSHFNSLQLNFENNKITKVKTILTEAF